jgi:hypothetical protein
MAMRARYGMLSEMPENISMGPKDLARFAAVIKDINGTFSLLFSSAIHVPGIIPATFQAGCTLPILPYTCLFNIYML